jgi:hypothetical protein
MGVGTGTVRSAGPPAAAAGGGHPGSDLRVVTGPAAAAAAGAVGGGQQKPVYARLPSLQQLSVDLNALNPEASSAAGGLVGAPGGAGGGAIPIMSSRLVWQDGSSSTLTAAAAGGGRGGTSAAAAAAAAGEGPAVLSRVLLPALQSLQDPGGAANTPLQVGCVLKVGNGSHGVLTREVQPGDARDQQQAVCVEGKNASLSGRGGAEAGCRVVRVHWHRKMSTGQAGRSGP